MNIKQEMKKAVIQELIGDSWKTVSCKTKIFLDKDQEFVTFNNKTVTLKKGYYYINGFWVNVVGLSTTWENCQRVHNEFVISSKALERFYRVKKE